MPHTHSKAFAARNIDDESLRVTHIKELSLKDGAIFHWTRITHRLIPFSTSRPSNSITSPSCKTTPACSGSKGTALPA